MQAFEYTTETFRVAYDRESDKLRLWVNINANQWDYDTNDYKKPLWHLISATSNGVYVTQWMRDMQTVLDVLKGQTGLFA